MFESWRRIFTVSKKPDWQEYSLMLKVTALGIVVVAAIGFFMLLFFTLTGLGKPA